MKLITKIALVALIVGFPLASWYYLNRGLEFRKQALRELTPKGVWEIEGLDRIDFEFQTSVIFFDSSLREKMALINEQYQSSPTFQMVELVDDKEYKADWKTIYFDAQSSAYDSLYQNIFLIDEDLQLRKSYGKSHKELNRLIEHIAIILPREKEPDIKIRVDNEGK